MDLTISTSCHLKIYIFQYKNDIRLHVQTDATQLSNFNKNRFVVCLLNVWFLTSLVSAIPISPKILFVFFFFFWSAFESLCKAPFDFE